jgi:hypothetical protein
MSLRYDRVLSDDFEALLAPGGVLHFLVRDHRGWIDGDPDALDIQLRENDEVMVYQGTTRLLVVASMGDELKLSAHASYGEYPGCAAEYAAVMGVYPVSAAASLEGPIRAYLRASSAAAWDRHYGNRQEGFWQNRLCQYFGAEFEPAKPWLVIDREAVIGHRSRMRRQAFYRNVKKPYEDVRCAHQAANPAAWGQFDGEGYGDELDLLAIGPDGELLCIELKHGGNAAGIYFGPLQAAVYRDAFRLAHRSIAGRLIELAQQKVRLGLLPARALERLPADGRFRSVEAVLAVGDPNEDSTCWVQLKTIRGLSIVPELEVVQLGERVEMTVVP